MALQSKRFPDESVKDRKEVHWLRYGVIVGGLALAGGMWTYQKWEEARFEAEARDISADIVEKLKPYLVEGKGVWFDANMEETSYSRSHVSLMLEQFEDQKIFGCTYVERSINSRVEKVLVFHCGPALTDDLLTQQVPDCLALPDSLDGTSFLDMYQKPLENRWYNFLFRKKVKGFSKEVNQAKFVEYGERILKEIDEERFAIENPSESVFPIDFGGYEVPE